MARTSSSSPPAAHRRRSGLDRPLAALWIPLVAIATLILLPGCGASRGTALVPASSLPALSAPAARAGGAAIVSAPTGTPDGPTGAVQTHPASRPPEPPHPPAPADAASGPAVVEAHRPAPQPAAAGADQQRPPTLVAPAPGAGATGAGGSGGRWIRAAGPTPPLDLSVFARPLADVIALIAEHAGVNLVLSDEPDVWEKKITAELRGQPWHLALEAILEAHGLRATQTEQGIIMVVSAARAEDDREPEPIRLRYLYARDLLPAVADMLSVGRDSTANAVQVYGDPRSSRVLIAYASPEKLAKIRGLVRRLDRRPPRVSVEVRMVHVNRTAMQRLGLSYSFGIFTDSLGVPFAGVRLQPLERRPLPGITSEDGPALQLVRRLAFGGPLRLNVFLDAATSAGIAETETTPVITANSGVTSEIMVGDAFILPSQQLVFASGGYAGPIPAGPPGFDARAGVSPARAEAPVPIGAPLGGYPSAGFAAGGFARFETGTSLRVTPYVLGEDEVSMTIDLIRDGGTLSPDGRSIIGGKQSALTEVTVRNDTPIVIGGLTVNGRSSTESGVPGLARLPLLGRLFRTEQWATQHQDLVIVVTPHINQDDLDPETQQEDG